MVRTVITTDFQKQALALAGSETRSVFVGTTSRRSRGEHTLKLHGLTRLEMASR
jgi:hypothetical protein